MNFERSSLYHLRSNCGRYKVAKVIVQNEVQYEAWHESERIAGKFSSAQEAIDACRAHQDPRAASAA